MKIKKIVGLFALACTMFMATQMVSAASGTASLGALEDVDGNPVEYVQEGEGFRVPVYLDYAEGIENYQLNILYDVDLVKPGYDFNDGNGVWYADNNITVRNNPVGSFDTNVRDLVNEGALQLTKNEEYLGKTAFILQWYHTAKTSVTSAKPVAYAYFTANADIEGNVDVALTMDLFIAGYSEGNNVTDFGHDTTNVGTTTVLNKASVIKFEIAKNPGYFVHEVYVELDGTKYQLTKCTETETGYEFVVNVKNTGNAAKTVNSAKVIVAKADTEDATTYTEEVYADLGTVTVEKY